MAAARTSRAVEANSTADERHDDDKYLIFKEGDRAWTPVMISRRCGRRGRLEIPPFGAAPDGQYAGYRRFNL